MRRISCARSWSIALAAAALAAAMPGHSPAEQRLAVAVVVNPANQAPDPSLDELRAMFSLDKQFWPDGHRIALFLPGPGSPARAVLLDRVYAMSDFELRKLWVGKLFRGAIPSIPSMLPSTEALIGAVMESEGGMTAVPASEVPRGVRVLRIDGRAPGDPDYPLRTGR